MKLRLNDEKIWIAGHTGMVGQAISRQLMHCDVVTCDRAELDLRVESDVANWVEQNRPSVVFLAAAKVGGIKANAENPVEFLLDNLKIQTNVIEAAAKFGVKKLIFIGSACSYPKSARQPIVEADFLNGAPEKTNIWYATAKIAGVKLAQAFAAEGRLDSVVAMATNAYGPFDNFDEETSHVIPGLMSRFSRARLNRVDEMPIWGSGNALREFIYVDDLAEALIFLAEQYESSDLINVGSGSEVSVKTLAHLIAEVTGYSGRIVTDSSKPDGAPRKILDSKLINKLGWVSSTNLMDGLRSTYKWAHSNKLIGVTSKARDLI